MLYEESSSIQSKQKQSSIIKDVSLLELGAINHSLLYHKDQSQSSKQLGEYSFGYQHTSQDIEQIISYLAESEDSEQQNRMRFKAIQEKLYEN